jgi:hypothetical protein
MIGNEIFKFHIIIMIKEILSLNKFQIHRLCVKKTRAFLLMTKLYANVKALPRHHRYRQHGNGKSKLLNLKLFENWDKKQHEICCV